MRDITGSKRGREVEAAFHRRIKEYIDPEGRVWSHPGCYNEGNTRAEYEKKDFGSTSCSLLTPPPGDANGQFATICGLVVKEMLVMTMASSKPSVPMEKLKTLAESAAARLP